MSSPTDSGAAAGTPTFMDPATAVAVHAAAAVAPASSSSSDAAAQPTATAAAAQQPTATTTTITINGAPVAGTGAVAAMTSSPAPVASVASSPSQPLQPVGRFFIRPRSTQGTAAAAAVASSSSSNVTSPTAAPVTAPTSPAMPVVAASPSPSMLPLPSSPSPSVPHLPPSSPSISNSPQHTPAETLSAPPPVAVLVVGGSGSGGLESRSPSRAPLQQQQPPSEGATSPLLQHPQDSPSSGLLSSSDQDEMRTDLPPSHYGASMRPPTPPKERPHRRSRSNSTKDPRRASASAKDRSRRGSLDMDTTSGRDKFNIASIAAPAFNPNQSASSSSSQLPAATPLFQHKMSFDASGGEFSIALRAALSEASGGAGLKSSKARSGGGAGGGLGVLGAVGALGMGMASTRLAPRAPSMFDMGSSAGSEDGGAAAEAAAAGGVGGPVVVVGVVGGGMGDESTERALRKEAIRQKNAMHMRIRNASVSQASAMTAGRRGGTTVLNINTLGGAVAAAALLSPNNAADNLSGAPSSPSPATPARSPSQQQLPRRSQTLMSSLRGGDMLEMQTLSEEVAGGGGGGASSPNSPLHRSQMPPQQQPQQLPQPGSLAAFLTGAGSPGNRSGEPQLKSTPSRAAAGGGGGTGGGSNPGSSSTDPPKRVLSSILKPTQPLGSVAPSLPTTREHMHVPSSTTDGSASPRRTKSSLRRASSLKAGSARVGDLSLAASSAAAPFSAATSLPGGGGPPTLQRTHTKENSRVGFSAGQSENEDSDLSGNSDDSDGGGRDANKHRRPNGLTAAQRDAMADVAQNTTAVGSVKSRNKAPVASSSSIMPVGNQTMYALSSIMASSLAVPPHVGGGGGGGGGETNTGGGGGSSGGPHYRARKEVFAQEGSQLVLRSVSTVTGASMGTHSSQAANVMVLSVSSIFTRLRLYTDLCFILAVVGIMLTVVNKEIYSQFPRASMDSDTSSDDYHAFIAITVVRSLCSFSTVALIFCLYKLYQADFQFLQLNRVYLLRSAFWNTQLIWSFALEVLICLIHEPPFLNHDVDMSVTDTATLATGLFTNDAGASIHVPVIVRNPWSLLIVCRFYLFLRLVLSRYYTGGTKILGLWFNFSFNAGFAVRNIVFSHPFLSLGPLVTILICSCSYSLWVFEREAVPERHFSFGTAVWVVMITITAVGYGDVSPLSSGGRAVCIVSAFIGTILVAVLVAAVHQRLTLLPYQSRMVEFLERDSNSTALRYYAARCISRFWRYYHCRRKAIALARRHKFGLFHRGQLLAHKSVMLQGIFDFQTARKQIQAYDRRYHSEQLFRAMLEGLYDKLESMTLDLSVLEDELDLSYEEQRRVAAKHNELLEQVRDGVVANGGAVTAAMGAGAGGGGGSTASANKGGGAPTVDTASSSSAPGSLIPSATPSPRAGAAHPGGRLSLLLRPTSLSQGEHSHSGMNVPPQLGRPLSLAPPLPDEMHLYKGPHKSLRNSGHNYDNSSVAVHDHMLSAVVPGVGIAAAVPLNKEAPTPAGNDQRAHTTQLSTARVSTLGQLDLVAAAASAAAHLAQPAPQADPSASSATATAAASGLTSILSETPRHHDNVSLALPGGLRSTRRTTLGQDSPTALAGNVTTTTTTAPGQDVTSDLLAVVEAMSQEQEHMPPTPAGRIRFGESDFAAHRATTVSGKPSNARGVVMLQRHKTIDRGALGSMNAAAMAAAAAGGIIGADGNIVEPLPLSHTGLLSLRHGFRRPGSIELPNGSPTLGHNQSEMSATSAGAHSSSAPGTGVEPPLRPTVTRMGSGGGILRAVATARVAAAVAAGGASTPGGSLMGAGYGGAAHVTSDQFERMMLLLANMSERLAGVEAHLHLMDKPLPGGRASPRKSPHFQPALGFARGGERDSTTGTPTNVLAPSTALSPPSGLPRASSLASPSAVAASPSSTQWPTAGVAGSTAGTAAPSTNNSTGNSQASSAHATPQRPGAAPSPSH